MIDFNRVRYLTFDCYGTLIDWETGILNALSPILKANGVSLDDREILETFAELETAAESGPYGSYRRVLGMVVDGFGSRFGFEVGEPERAKFADSVGRWPPFPDSKRALARLGSRFKLVVLSNVDEDMFAGSSRQLGDPFDEVMTSARIGSYKPSPANFEFAIRILGGEPSAIVHVAQSLYHDILPAGQLGLKTVWINRRRHTEGGGATPAVDAKADIEFSTLDDFASDLEL